MSVSVPIASTPASATKPRLRGVSHQVAVFVALAACAALALRTERGPSRWAVLIFGGCLVAQLGISALYHRVSWGDGARQWMRRLDHSAIFLLIAGGYTPLFLLVPSATSGQTALVAVWAGAAVGVLKSLLWPHSPKWVTAAFCVGLGWLLTGQVLERAAIIGWEPIAWVVASGIVYSLGAAVYALKRPDPAPLVFGYHEVFHALVIAASALLFTHVVRVLASVSGLAP